MNLPLNTISDLSEDDSDSISSSGTMEASSPTKPLVGVGSRTDSSVTQKNDSHPILLKELSEIFRKSNPSFDVEERLNNPGSSLDIEIETQQQQQPQQQQPQQQQLTTTKATFHLLLNRI